MDTTTPMAATPYDYQTAQRILGQKYALAQALMGTQMPTAGQINRADIGGSQYSFYVPNTAGMVSSALQKVLGAYEMSKANTAAKQDVQQQRSAIADALSGMQPTPVTQDVPDQQTPQEKSDLAAANAPSPNAPGLSGVDVSGVPKEQLGYAPPSGSDYANAITQLEMAGPMAQPILAREFAPAKIVPNSVTGGYTAVNPYSGQPIAQGGSTGVMPKMAGTAWNVLNGADLNTPAGVVAANQAAIQLGLVPAGTQLTAAQLQGMRGRQQQVVQSNISRNTSLANQENANATYTSGAKTQQTLAAAERDLEATAAQKQATGLAGAGAVETANNNVANLNFQLGRTQDAIKLSQGFENGSLTGGKIFTTLGDAQNWLGKNPQYAAYRDYLTTSNMQQIVSALQHQGRITGNEVQTFSKELLNGSMPFTTVQYLLGQQAALLSAQKMNADINARNVGGAVGAANPTMNTQPVTPTPVPQISQSGAVRVKAPNGQMGTIPASQLQAALAQGYTQVQ